MAEWAEYEWTMRGVFPIWPQTPFTPED